MNAVRPTGARRTEHLRTEHRGLLASIEMLRSTAELVGTESASGARDRVDESLAFLAQQLLPHARAEELVLYPAVEEAMGAPGATATMRRDHAAIGALAEELRFLRERLRGPAISLDHAIALRRVLYGLHAIIRLHFDKEEELYLPVLDRWLTEEQAADLMGRLEVAVDATRTTSPGTPSAVPTGS